MPGTSSKSWVSVNGRVTSGAEACISVFDRGFLFGDSVYEVMRTVGGRPLFWRDHVERLRRSATYLRLDLAGLDATLRDEVEAVLARADWGESYVRLVVTRGEGDISVDPEAAAQPNRVVIVQPMPRVPEELRAGGCVLHVIRGTGHDVDPRAKSGNKLRAVLAQAEARAVGAYEALHVDRRGRILEGSTSTFFLVRIRADGAPAVCTPPLGVGILEGITRAKVLGLAEALGIETCEDDLTLDDLTLDDPAEAREAFITSSVRGIVPVRRIDDIELTAMGPVTARIVAAYEALLESR